MNQQQSQGESGGPLVHGEERRRSQRVILRIGVTIHSAATGRPSAILAFTADVNVHGALLISPEQFPVGAHFTLENNNTRERMLCRVTRMPQRMSEGFHVAAEFEKPAPNFWRVSFPPPDWKPFEN